MHYIDIDPIAFVLFVSLKLLERVSLVHRTIHLAVNIVSVGKNMRGSRKFCQRGSDFDKFFFFVF